MQPQPSNNSQIQPSYLRQIVDVVDAMSIEKQQKLLRKIKLQELVEKMKLAESTHQPSTLSEEEIYEMCSQTRREMYEEKLKNKK